MGKEHIEPDKGNHGFESRTGYDKVKVVQPQMQQCVWGCLFWGE